MRLSVVNLTIEHVITGLRTIEREIVINELDLSELNNFFDQEEQILTLKSHQRKT